MSEAAKIALKGPVRLARFESHLLHLRGLAARTVESTEIIAAALGLSEVAAGQRMERSARGKRVQRDESRSGWPAECAAQPRAAC